MGITWLSSGWDSMLSPLRAQVQFLVGELRSHQPCGTAEKKKTTYTVCNLYSNFTYFPKNVLYTSPPLLPHPQSRVQSWIMHHVSLPSLAILTVCDF